MRVYGGKEATEPEGTVLVALTSSRCATLSLEVKQVIIGGILYWCESCRYVSRCTIDRDR